MEYCIVYFSTSVGLLEEEDLRVILEQSRNNNAKAGITGILLYVRGSIVQVLEGEKQILEALYKRIQQDQRHKNVTRVLSRPIEQRLFSDWAMGFETITTRQVDTLKAIVNIDSPHETAPQPTDHSILKMLKLFYDSNRRN